MQTPLELLFLVVEVLEKLSVNYVVGGSWASSTRGVVRATNDVDIVTDLREEQVLPLVTAVQDDFYVDELSVRRAIAQGRSFNLIHFDSSFKVDIFIPPPGGFGWQQLDRGRPEEIRQGETVRSIFISTAEDIILAKLLWYVAGGQVSSQQWADILGIIKVQGATLDTTYLHAEAQRLAVILPLERAFGEAKSSGP